MQTIRVRTTQNVFIDYPVGSLGDRILAFLVDQVILILYTVAIIAILVQLKVQSVWVVFIILGLPWLFYSLLFEIFMNGQTPGKLALKIKVVRLNGTPPTVGDYLLRWIFAPIDFYIMSGVVAVVIIATGGKGQRLGDIVAGTSVVKLVEHHEITASQVFVTAEEKYSPVFPEVTQLTSREIELIQRALEVNRDHGNIQPAILATERVKSALNIQTDLPPVKFLYTIIKDFNHLTSQQL
jgi:uncharacterized RDD family membrane protein YckC